MSEPELLAICSAFSGAIAALLAKRLLGSIQSWQFIGPNFLIIFAMLVPFAPFAFHFDPSSRALLLITGVILIDIVANWGLFESIRRADLAQVVPALGLVPVFAIAVAMVVFPEDTDGVRVVFALAVVGGTVALQVMDTRATSNRSAGSRRGTAYGAIAIALGSSFAFGVSANLSKLLLDTSLDSTNPYSLYLLRAAGIGLIMIVVAGGFDAVRHHLVPIAGRAIFVILQWLTFLTAIRAADVISVTTFANLTPVLAGIGSAVLLKEAWNWRRTSAVAVAFVGSAALLAR